MKKTCSRLYEFLIASPPLNFQFFWRTLALAMVELGGQPLNRPEMVGVDGWNSGMAEPAPPHDCVPGGSPSGLTDGAVGSYPVQKWYQDPR